MSLESDAGGKGISTFFSTTINPESKSPTRIDLPEVSNEPTGNAMAIIAHKQLNDLRRNFITSFLNFPGTEQIYKYLPDLLKL